MDDIQKDIEEINQAWEDAMEKNEKLGDGVCVGKVVGFRVADGKAVYEVVEVGEKISIVKYRSDLVLDEYSSDAVDHETGEVLTNVVRQRLEHQKTLRNL